MLKGIIFFIVFLIYASTCSGAKCLPIRPIAGGIQTADVKDANVIAAADFAINQLYGSRNYVVVSAKKQIVAGKNYFLTVQFLDNGEECQIRVYDRFGNKSITSNTCSSFK
jgi:hypothetical protein